MAVGRGDECVECVLDEPGVGVEEQDVLRCRRPDPGVPAGRDAAVLALDDAHAGEPLPDEVDGAVGRAVVDDDRLDAGDAPEALGDPGQRVIRDDHARDARAVVSHARAGIATRP